MPRNLSKSEIAAMLKRIRIRAKLTQQQAADAIGRKRQTLASWETGQSQPDVNTLFSLCDLYGISIDDVFGRSESGTLNTHELDVIAAYRQNLGMQAAVDKLLGLADDDAVRVYRAAKSDDNAEGGVVELPRRALDKLKTAKSTDEI